MQHGYAEQLLFTSFSGHFLMACALLASLLRLYHLPPPKAYREADLSAIMIVTAVIFSFLQYLDLSELKSSLSAYQTFLLPLSFIWLAVLIFVLQRSPYGLLWQAIKINSFQFRKQAFETGLLYYFLGLALLLSVLFSLGSIIFLDASLAVIVSLAGAALVLVERKPVAILLLLLVNIFAMNSLGQWIGVETATVFAVFAYIATLTVFRQLTATRFS